VRLTSPVPNSEGPGPPTKLVRPRKARPKVAVSVRLDPQVLAWPRAQGEGHLTRTNDILSNLMEAESRANAGK
jgi:uncharacterized protein (DUF4415 family)